MKTYTARSDAEATGLHDGTITLLVIPMEPQPLFYGEPGDLYSFRSDLASGSRECRTFKSHKYPESGLHNFPVSSPYASGDEIGVKEVWALVPVGDGRKMGYIYRADGASAFDAIAEGWEFMGEWETAESMPNDAIRPRLLCESAVPKQVQNIITSASEIMETGIIYDADAPMIGPCECDAGDLIEQFSAEWDRRHPSTPWAGNPWAWFCRVRKGGWDCRICEAGKHRRASNP